MHLECTSDVSSHPALLFLLKNWSIPVLLEALVTSVHQPRSRCEYVTEAWPVMVPHLLVRLHLSERITKQVQADFLGS